MFRFWIENKILSEEGKTAILILPLVALEPQFEADMQRLGLRYVSLTRSPVDSLEEEIRIKKPHVLLGNVESLSVQDIQRQICKMQISYIAVDEAQVKPCLAKELFSFLNRWQILWRGGLNSGPILRLCGAGSEQHTKESHSCSVLQHWAPRAWTGSSSAWASTGRMSRSCLQPATGPTSSSRVDAFKGGLTFGKYYD